MTTYRPTPPKSDSERVMPDRSEIRKHIGQLYNNQVSITKNTTTTTFTIPYMTEKLNQYKLALKQSRDPSPAIMNAFDLQRTAPSDLTPREQALFLHMISLSQLLTPSHVNMPKLNQNIANDTSQKSS